METNKQKMSDYPQYAEIYDNDYTDDEDEVTSPYYGEDYEIIDINDDAYWDIYFTPMDPDTSYTFP
jgi:hypothetical protein